MVRDELTRHRRLRHLRRSLPLVFSSVDLGMLGKFREPNENKLTQRADVRWNKNITCTMEDIT